MRIVPFGHSRGVELINPAPLNQLCSTLTLELKINVRHTIIPNSTGGNQYVIINFGGNSIAKEHIQVRIIYDWDELHMHKAVMRKLNKQFPEFTI